MSSSEEPTHPGKHVSIIHFNCSESEEDNGIIRYSRAKIHALSERIHSECQSQNASPLVRAPAIQVFLNWAFSYITASMGRIPLYTIYLHTLRSLTATRQHLSFSSKARSNSHHPRKTTARPRLASGHSSLTTHSSVLLTRFVPLCSWYL